MARDLLKYIRTDKNGTKIYEDWECPRCGGQGWAGQWKYTGVFCFRCGGSGLRNRPRIVKEYTDEYFAKLEAKRIAKQKKYEEEHADEIAAAKAEQERLEAEWAAQAEAERLLLEEIERKARGHYYGEVGQKIEMEVTYRGNAEFETAFGWMSIYRFDTDDGAHLVWKTSALLGGGEWMCREDDRITIKATIKGHREYHGIEQTELTRVKVIKAQLKLNPETDEFEPYEG